MHDIAARVSILIDYARIINMAEGKEGKNDFVWLLLIVFIILGALLAASVWYPYYPEGAPESERVLHTFGAGAGTLGYTQNYVSRVQEYGDFGVGVPQEEVLTSAPMIEVSAGLLGGERESFDLAAPDYVQDWKKGGSITFRVSETNQYGDLVVRWNGDEVYRGRASVGEYDIDLEAAQIKGQNTLEVYADGPGLMFWATTVYQLKDLEAKASYGPAKFLDFAVSQDELETLDHFELAWYTKSRRGNLSVSINGGEIYNAYPERDVSISFTDTALGSSILRPGNNRLMFASVNATDSFELSDVLINTHVSRSQKTVKEKVTITHEQMQRIQARGASLTIYVTKIDKAGRITLSVNEQQSGSVEGKVGVNTVAVNKALVKEGENWFEISSTGAFTVSEAKVEMA
jgi:hypothetical protein